LNIEAFTCRLEELRMNTVKTLQMATDYFFCFGYCYVLSTDLISRMVYLILQTRVKML